VLSVFTILAPIHINNVSFDKMKTIKNIIVKFKKWCEGEYIPVSVERAGDVVMVLNEHYKKPPILVFFNRLWNFWKDNWKILLPIIIGAIVALFIHFDSKSTSKTEQEKNKTVSESHIEKPQNINKK